MQGKTFKIDSAKENLAKLDLFIDWCDFLSEHEAEARETLASENLDSESMELYVDNAVFYIHAKSVVTPGKKPQPSDQTVPLNRVHKKLWLNLEKEVIETGLPETTVLQRILYSFVR